MRSPFSSRSGFSLIEVLMATAIMSVLSVGMMQMFESLYKQAKSVNTSSNNMQLGLRIARYAGMASALTATATANANSNFTKCVLGTGTGTCANAGIALRDPAGTVVAGASAAAPILYDLNSAVCAVAGPNCPFAAVTTFTRSASMCGSIACFITMSYSITQVSDIPNTTRLKPTTGTVTVQLPLAATWMGNGNRLAMWSTSTDLIAGNIVQNAGQIQINEDSLYAGTAEAMRVNGKVLLVNNSGGVAAGCAGTAAGTMRNANGALEVCDGANWQWAAGRVDSSSTSQAFSSGLGTFPTARMPGVYVCPGGASPAHCEVCGRGPACTGQMQTGKECWTCTINAAGCTGSTVTNCTALF